MRSRLFLFFIFLCFYKLSHGQSFSIPTGKFLKDSIKIGEPVDFTLSIRYPSKQFVLFPDSNYHFFPFEFVKKRSFPTHSINGWSVDSAIYTIRTFEMNSVNIFSLPVFFLEGNDSTIMQSNSDSVYLKFIIKESPTSKNLKEELDYQPISTYFNYPYWIAGITIFFILVSVLILLFGKKIKKYFQLRRLKKNYEKFDIEFEHYFHQLSEQNYIQPLEKIYQLWKNYLQNLENIPYSSYSSQEISSVIQDSELRKLISLIDKAIYGFIYSSDIKINSELLKKIAEKKYKEKINSIN